MERGLYDYISYYKIVGVKHKNLQIKNAYFRSSIRCMRATIINLLYHAGRLFLFRIIRSTKLLKI